MRSVGPMRAVIDALLARGVEENAVPGVLFAVTSRDGTVYEGAFGRRDLRRQAPIARDTVFGIASLTKAMVSAGVMQLVEQGRLDLDARAGQYVPYLGIVQVLEGFEPDGTPRLRPPTSPVTLRQLLTHTSGFGYGWLDARIGRYEEAAGLSGASGVKTLEMPLLSDPGTRWQYSIGLGWAGQMLEAATGQRLGVYLDTNLFEPLGITAGWGINEGQTARLASVHIRMLDGTLSLRDPPGARVSSFENGGGGIYTTAPDYLRFIRMILNEGSLDGVRVLRPETVALMSRPDAAPNNNVTMMLSANRAVSNDGEFFPGLPKRQGLGFMVNEVRAPTGRSAGSLAWAGINNTYFWIDPALGVGGVYMTQVAPFLDYHALPLFHAVERAVYDHWS